jgi:peptidoglycan/xylan/chitin deacetylase (PgdA/CDA1 family)
MTKPLILMYHRIADEPIDYWGLAVSPNHFEQQLSVLRRTRYPLTLTELVRRLVDNTLPMDAVAVTFDDGYVDNLTAGLPRLAAAGVPATVFLTTSYIDRREPIWSDELAMLILLEQGPKRSEITIEGKLMSLGLTDASLAPSSNPAQQERRALLEAIYQLLRRLDDKKREPIMTELRSIFTSYNDGAELPRTMTHDEVRMLIKNNLVTIGAHSVTHPILPELPLGAQHHEIAASKCACEAITGAPVTAFAYPYGEFNPDVRETARRAGFSFACSTQRGPATAASDVFALPRVYVPNVDGDAFEQRLYWASRLG